MFPQAKNPSLEPRVTNIESWLKWLLRASGLTLVGLLAFAFWLGTISAKVSHSEETINKVYGAVSENPNSLMVRTSLIEAKLTELDKKFSSMDAKFNDMDSKLNDLVRRLDMRERNTVTAKPIPEQSHKKP